MAFLPQNRKLTKAFRDYIADSRFFSPFRTNVEGLTGQGKLRAAGEERSTCRSGPIPGGNGTAETAP